MCRDRLLQYIESRIAEEKKDLDYLEPHLQDFLEDGSLITDPDYVRDHIFDLSEWDLKWESFNKILSFEEIKREMENME